MFCSTIPSFIISTLNTCLFTVFILLKQKNRLLLKQPVKYTIMCISLFTCFSEESRNKGYKSNHPIYTYLHKAEIP